MLGRRPLSGRLDAALASHRFRTNLPFRLAQACVSVERLSNFLAPYNLEGYALHSPSGCWYVVGAWRSTVYEKMSKKEEKAIS